MNPHDYRCGGADERCNRRCVCANDAFDERKHAGSHHARLANTHCARGGS